MFQQNREPVWLRPIEALFENHFISAHLVVQRLLRQRLVISCQKNEQHICYNLLLATPSETTFKLRDGLKFVDLMTYWLCLSSNVD